MAKKAAKKATKKVAKKATKKVAKKVRVFEPINTDINECHPHSLTVDLFKKHFPNTDIKLYVGGTITIFHLADCCYFIADNE